MKTNSSRKERGFDAILATHVYSSGDSPPSYYLKDFFCGVARSLLYFRHPLRESQERNSTIELYNHAAMVSRVSVPRAFLPDTLLYLGNTLFTALYILKQGQRYSLYVGLDPLCAFVGIVLARLRIVRHTVLYAIDYSPARFRSQFLNGVYHLIYAISASNCDVVWDNSASIKEKRASLGIKTRAEIIVPPGVDVRNVVPQDIKEVVRERLAYSGGLSNEFGIQLILDSMLGILKQVPSAELIITGLGEGEQAMMKFIEEHDLGAHVRYLGYIPDHKELERLLAKCGIGLAIYNDNPLSYKKYSDVAKPRLYMSCGLPVIITNVPQNAKAVAERKAGLVINYDARELREAVLLLATNEKLYTRMRENAIAFSKEFDWQAICARAFEDSLPHLKS